MNTIQAEQCLRRDESISTGSSNGTVTGDNSPQNKTKKAQAMMRLGKKNLGVQLHNRPRCT